jgi:Ca2+-binding RTX toxin-like protein
MRRFTLTTIRLAAAVATGVGLSLAGAMTAGAQPTPPTTPIACTISGSGVLVGTPGNDVICGSSGNDTIYGVGGNDQLYGGAGADTLSGGSGNDWIYGGAGGDQLFGDGGLGDHLYAKDGTASDTLHDPDGTYYQLDGVVDSPMLPHDTIDFTGLYTNYHYVP